MNNRNSQTMLELQTNLLAGMFVLFVLFSVTAGRGKGQESQSVKTRQGTEFLSTVEYLQYDKRKEDLPILHIYLELDGSKNSMVDLILTGNQRVIDSCTLVVSPYGQNRKTWSASRVGKVSGAWSIQVANTEKLSTPIEGKVHVFNGTVHSCSIPITIIRTTGTLVEVIEYATAAPQITIANESCL